MNKCELRKEPYEEPKIGSFTIAVEKGFAISDENGAGGGSFGEIGEEYEIGTQKGSMTSEYWGSEEYY